jgi:hypothetical protein
MIVIFSEAIVNVRMNARSLPGLVFARSTTAAAAAACLLFVLLSVVQYSESFTLHPPPTRSWTAHASQRRPLIINDHVQINLASWNRQPQQTHRSMVTPGDTLVESKSDSLSPKVPHNDNMLFDTKGMTERIMKRTVGDAQTSGAGGSSTWDAFVRTEANWLRLKTTTPTTKRNSEKEVVPTFVTDDGARGNPACWAKLRQQYNDDTADSNKRLDFDVVVCGGTLGIFFALALQLRGHKVCVVEAAKLQGRAQEWNLSRQELDELVALGVLTVDDVDAVITTEFPACRSGFKVRYRELWRGLVSRVRTLRTIVATSSSHLSALLVLTSMHGRIKK